jgi:hypothetical protein
LRDEHLEARVAAAVAIKRLGFTPIPLLEDPLRLAIVGA